MVKYSYIKFYKRKETSTRMEEKKVTKINLSTFFLIIAIVIILVMGVFIYKLNSDRTTEIQKSTELQAKVNNLSGAVSELQGKINKSSNTISGEANNVSNSEISYVTYSKNGIEFKYPSTFKQTTDTFESSGFEAIEDSDQNRFQIQEENLLNFETLKDIVKREEELKMPDGTKYRTLMKDDEYITLANGIKGYKFETVTYDNACQIIFLTQKDNTAYQFTFTINDKSKYDNHKEVVDKIFDSLTMKTE